MPTPHKRDPESGRIVVNGKMGAFRAWAEWMAPILRSITTAGVIALCVYVLWHYSQHRSQVKLNERMEDFMSAGGRVYSSTGEATSTQQLEQRFRAIVISEIESRVPPPEQLAFNASQIETNIRIEGAVEANHSLLLELLKQGR